MVHGGMIQHPSGLTKRATDYIDEFKDSQVHLAIPVSVGAVQRWRPPSGSVFKVNFDASVFASTDSSGGPFGVYKRGSRSFSLQEGSRACC